MSNFLNFRNIYSFFRSSKNNISILVSLIGITTLLFAFQNCGKAGFDTMGSENASLNVSQDASSAAAPFAFKIGFDTISYSSCYGPKAANIPSFKLSANSTQGIQISKQFHEYALSHIQPVYNPDNPNDTSIKPYQIKNFIVETTENKDVYPRLSMVAKGNVSYPFSASGNPVVGTDIVNLLGNLNDDRYLETLVENIEANVQHFPLIPASNAVNMDNDLQGQLTYNDSSAQVSAVRNSFYIPNSDGKVSMLASTFAKLGSDDMLRPNTDTTKAYGIGYQLGFDVARDPNTNLAYGGASPNVLSTIKEVDLASNTILASNWNCNLKLKVVRKKDRNTYCPVETLSQAQARLTDLQIVRRHLPEDIWDINLANHCAVLKNETGTNTFPENSTAQQMSCYGDEVQIVSGKTKNEVQYDPTQPCYNVDNPDVQQLNICAQYITICTKVQ